MQWRSMALTFGQARIKRPLMQLSGQKEGSAYPWLTSQLKLDSILKIAIIRPLNQSKAAMKLVYRLKTTRKSQPCRRTSGKHLAKSKSSVGKNKAFAIRSQRSNRDQKALRLPIGSHAYMRFFKHLTREPAASKRTHQTTSTRTSEWALISRTSWTRSRWRSAACKAGALLITRIQFHVSQRQ